jgi:hypothetical protein
LVDIAAISQTNRNITQQPLTILIANEEAGMKSVIIRQLLEILGKPFEFRCRAKSRNQMMVQQPGERAVNAIFAAEHFGFADRFGNAAIGNVLPLQRFKHTFSLLSAAVNQATGAYRAIDFRLHLADWRFEISPPHRGWTGQKRRR